MKDLLKEYDNEFRKQFSRDPVKREKEPMRAVYIYYKNIKEEIGKLEKMGKKTEEKQRNEPEKAKKFSSSFDNSMPSNDLLIQNPHKKKVSEPILRLQGVKLTSSLTADGLKRSELEEKLQELRKIKQDLHQKLTKYQEDFIQTHNRKIKFQNDIGPVAKEYQQYKDIKKQIHELDDKLKTME